MNFSFLRDVLICSLGAYGGPEAHLGVFVQQMVAKRGYLSEEELVELLALCSVLPGPTSTQTIVSIGYKVGGARLALLTLMVWAAPVVVVMTLLSFLYGVLSYLGVSSDLLRYVGPMAVGFIVLAAYRIGRKVIKDKTTIALMVFSGVVTYFVRSPLVFPVLLVFGGLVSIALRRKTALWRRVAIAPPWAYVVVFAAIALGGLLLTFVTDALLVHLFEKFYRYGYLVFGGGQVVIPVMHTELVPRYLSHEEFLTGYGLVQGLPGPMFSFAAYAGGMAARGGGIVQQIGGALMGAVGIFLPGLLLIFFVFPVWERVREIPAIKVALVGVNAIAGGMIVSAAFILLNATGISLPNMGVVMVTVLLLLSRRVPAPVLVLVAIVAGIF